MYITEGYGKTTSVTWVVGKRLTGEDSRKSGKQFCKGRRGAVVLLFQEHMKLTFKVVYLALAPGRGVWDRRHCGIAILGETFAFGAARRACETEPVFVLMCDLDFKKCTR